jgi:hypothetical protein
MRLQKFPTRVAKKGITRVCAHVQQVLIHGTREMDTRMTRLHGGIVCITGATLGSARRHRRSFQSLNGMPAGASMDNGSRHHAGRRFFHTTRCRGTITRPANNERNHENANKYQNQKDPNPIVTSVSLMVIMGIPIVILVMMMLSFVLLVFLFVFRRLYRSPFHRRWRVFGRHFRIDAVRYLFNTRKILLHRLPPSPLVAATAAVPVNKQYAEAHGEQVLQAMVAA